MLVNTLFFPMVSNCTSSFHLVNICPANFCPVSFCPTHGQAAVSRQNCSACFPLNRPDGVWHCSAWISTSGMDQMVSGTVPCESAPVARTRWCLALFRVNQHQWHGPDGVWHCSVWINTSNQWQTVVVTRLSLVSSIVSFSVLCLSTLMPSVV